MRTLLSLLLSLPLLLPALSNGADTPYIEISVNGLETIAPPLDRLAAAVENLSNTDNLSADDRETIVTVIAELSTLGDQLDTSIQKTRQAISQTQQEISASIKQMLILALLGLVASVIIICAAIFILFQRQISPLVNTTTTSLEKFAAAMDNLAASSRQISAQQAPPPQQ